MIQQGHRGPGAGAALVALAGLCWGLSGGIAAVLLADGWDAFMLALYRGATGLVFVLGWLALRPRGSGLADHRLWFWSGVAGLGVAGNFVFYFISLSHGSIAVAATLMYCAPVYVYLASFAFRLEASSPFKWTSIALLMLGIVLLTRLHDVGPGGITAIGVIAGLLSGMCYAAFIFGFRNASSHGSPPAILAIAFAILVMALAWFVSFEQVVAVPGSPDWPLFAMLGVLGGALSFYLYVVGIRRTRPTDAAIVAMVEPITATLFGVAIMGESLTAVQLAGMLLILVTVASLSASSKH